MLFIIYDPHIFCRNYGISKIYENITDALKKLQNIQLQEIFLNSIN